jgi:uroporphyrin-III C-methyltransferase
VVYLIGAGPGDPELMTLKAARALGRADVILIDALVSRGCLAHARHGARVIDVGKRAGCFTPQESIEKLIIQYASQGKCVARLKGGDPFVFGRGGEEADRLRGLGIPVDVIPGITAGTAVPATLGIPVTHRDVTHGVTFITGHGVEHDWEALVRSRTTLVVYMGAKNLATTVSRLLQAGMRAATPACVIENGTLRNQRQVVTTLADLSADGFTGPVMIVIGDVVRFAKATVGKAKAA